MPKTRTTTRQRLHAGLVAGVGGLGRGTQAAPPGVRCGPRRVPGSGVA
ncbi:hypothetical protein [Xylella fastidiosa]